MQVSKLLNKLQAEADLQEWAEGKSFDDIFFKCPKGEWLLYLFQNTNPDDLRMLTLVKGYCANTIRFFIQNERIRKAIDAAIDYGLGKISLNKLSSLLSETSDLESNYFAKLKTIEKKYSELDFSDERYLNSNIDEVARGCIDDEHIMNSIFHSIAQVGNNVVDIKSPAGHISYYTSECVFEIVENYWPFERVEYAIAHNPYEPSKLVSFKTMYSNYVKYTTSASINDSAEIAKINNQFATAEICRNLLPINIWNI